MTDKTSTHTTNCWEYMSCGREPGGARVHEFGACAAASAIPLDGLNNGTNAGRACWVIPGTLCNGVICGDFDEKYAHCRHCDFFELVQFEEGPDYVNHVELLVILARAGEPTTAPDE